MLFIIVLDTLTKDIQKEAPWNMMLADDIILAGEQRSIVERDAQIWVQRLEKKGLRVSGKRTEYMVASFSGQFANEELTIGNEALKKVNLFKYLGEVMSSDGSLEEEINLLTS